MPALRYTLLPTLRDARSGNQIAGFYKCFMEQHNLFRDKEVNEKREAWLVAPIEELRGVEELKGYGGLAVKQAQRAARMESVNWQIVDDLREDGMYLLLPDLQQLRELARVLRLRTRGEIARGEFPAAVETIQAHLALARTLNEHPTLIGSLVGIAIAASALTSVEEFIAAPGAPNLFWALADLPAPLFDLRKAAQGERVFFTRELETLVDRVNPMTEVQIGKAVMKVTEFVDAATLQTALAPAKGKVDPPAPQPVRKTVSTYLGERAADPKLVAEARARLMPRPPTRDERVEAFPPMQVILLDEVNKFEASRDDVLKWLTIPHWQIPAGAEKQTTPGAFAPLGPSVLKVSIAKARIEQQIGMLRVVEAVRAHAAANGGRLPGSFDEVRLPLAVDPFSGKAFGYQLADGMASVRGTPPADRKDDATLNRVYEMTLRK